MNPSNQLPEESRKWCQLVAKGASETEAYAKVFGCSVSEAGEDPHFLKLYHLIHDSEVKDELAKLRTDLENQKCLSREERIKYLTRIITTPLNELEPGDPILTECMTTDEGGNPLRVFKKPDTVAAIAELNKMTGAYAPQVIEVSLKDSPEKFHN